MLRQVAPGNAGAVAVDDALDHEAVVLERASRLAVGIGHQRSNQLPLGIGEAGVTGIHPLILPNRIASD